MYFSLTYLQQLLLLNLSCHSIVMSWYIEVVSLYSRSSNLHLDLNHPRGIPQVVHKKMSIATLSSLKVLCFPINSVNLNNLKGPLA